MVDIGGSTSVQFGPPRSNLPAVNRRMSMRKFGDGDNPREILVDIFPSAIGLSVSVTNGSISNPIERAENVIEFLTFSNTNRAQLRHGDITNLTITQIGDFRNERGVLLSPIVSYDGDTSEIVLTQSAYGIVKVTYQAPFRRYTYTFKGDCPANRPAIDPFTGEEQEVFEQATIIATLPSTLFGLAVTTLDVENPNSRCPFQISTGQPNPLVLEIVDQDWSNKNVGSIEFESRVRLFPSNIPDVVLSTARGSILFDRNKTLKVSNEILQFNRSSNASIRYGIESFDVVNDLGGLIDEFGRVFNAGSNQFKLSGSKVIRGVWNSSGRFTPSGEIITVKPGEVYVTDPAGKERAVNGALRVNYSVDFKEYVYKHEVSEEQGGNKVIAHNDVVTARSNSTKRGGLLVIPQGFKAAPNLARSES